MTEVATTSSIKLKAMEDSPEELKRFIKILHQNGDEKTRKTLRHALIDFLGETAADHQKDGSQAVKHDHGKPQYHLLPNDVLQQVGQVLAFGASGAKYGPHNWRKGMAWSRMFDAAHRHIWAFWEGEDNDPESGLPHLAHAVTCLMFLCSYHLSETGEDDRYDPSRDPLMVPRPRYPWEAIAEIARIMREERERQGDEDA